MNFEKWMKKRGHNKLNAYAKNPYHVSWIKRLPTWSKVVVPAALAMSAAVVVVTVGVLPMAFARKNAATQSGMSTAMGDVTRSTFVSSMAPSAVESDPGFFESLNIFQKYPTFTYANNLYRASQHIIEPQYIGKSISQFTIESTKYSGLNEEVTLYAISSVDKDIALLVKPDSESIFYLYTNKDASFDNLDDFLTKTSFIEHSTIFSIKSVSKTSAGNITYQQYKPHTSFKQTDFYNILFEDKTVAGQLIDQSVSTQINQATTGYYFEIAMDWLPSAYFGMTIYNNGYLTIDFADIKEAYKLADTKYKEVSTYLQNGISD